ncbi:MAG TPA: hypothetical protein VIO61_04875 [Anaerolineaceae bacterium]
MKVERLRLLQTWLLLALLPGAAAAIFYFGQPSEPGRAAVLGLSLPRLFTGAFFLLILAGILGLLLSSRRSPSKFSVLTSRLDERLNHPGTFLAACWAALSAVLICSEAYLLTYLSLPAHLRAWIIWSGWLALLTLVGLILLYPRQSNRLCASIWERLRHPAHWGTPLQRKTFSILVLIGLVYFIIFIPPNLLNTKDLETFQKHGGDEKITYPPLTWMLTPGSTAEETVYRLLIYEDYHYGYPFYALSALVILPSRLVFGMDFAAHTQVNLLLLRQLISILPMILAALLLVYLQTRFKAPLRAILIYLLLLSLPPVIGNNIRFWHPDALLTLSAVLVIAFLDRDQLRFGSSFFAAAVFCGLAAGIKLYGFFFFLAVGGYLLAGLRRRRVTWSGVLWRGAAFLLIMVLTIALTNPFLFYQPARQRMLDILAEKNQEMSTGYLQPDPYQIYQPGLAAWLPFLEDHYANVVFLGFLAVSLLVGGWKGRSPAVNWLTLAWFLPLSGYLFTFVAVKSVHYWLPVMLPFFSGAFGLADAADDAVGATGKPPVISPILWQVIWLVVLAVVSIQMITNLEKAIHTIAGSISGA